MRKFIRKLKRKISTVWYWLRTHTYNRYHIIDVRCPRNGYSWGWMDRDQVMLFACFKILEDFVEKELPHDQTDWDYDDDYRARRKEIADLYNWWKTGRKQEHDAASALLKEFKCDFVEVGDSDLEDGSKFFTVKTTGNVAAADQYGKLMHEILPKRDDEMLERLMKIRPYLWT